MFDAHITEHHVSLLLMMCIHGRPLDQYCINARLRLHSVCTFLGIKNRTLYDLNYG